MDTEQEGSNSLVSLTEEAVLGALREFQLVGKDEFLKKYGPGARTRYISHEGRAYDLKPVWRAAFGHMPNGRALNRKDGSYRLNSDIIQNQVEALGFNIDIKVAKERPGTEGETTRDSVTQPLNRIFLGPPGTGKTYKTFEHCLLVCDGQIPSNRQQMRKRYEALRDDGRIEFVTFHQSYGYEEFVEGIRPVEEGGQVFYRLEPGILRKLADKARSPTPRSSEIAPLVTGESALPFIDRVPRSATYALSGSYSPDAKAGSIIERIYNILKEAGEPLIGDHIVTKVEGFVGPESGERKTKNEIAGTLRWLVQKERLHVVAREAETTPKIGVDYDTHTNFVLVIDEINRANVSKVMGELITLLEEDKRAGAVNEVKVTLPYSGDQFTLPANLHILGTMNTADRSIALLDTALRRRFRFEEITPDASLLEEAGKRTGVDLSSVLTAMNKRLEYLVDRDHLIGHAWMMHAQDRQGLDDIMRHKIIPLIAEYFYEDWQKVRAVLGGTDDFVKRVELEVPPGVDSHEAEKRYHWSVRTLFATDAYERLVGESGAVADVE